MSTLSLWSKILFLSASALISVSAAPQPGSVDPTFDPGRGPLAVDASSGNSALIQPDGKILVAGEFNGVNLDFVPAVVRFNSDGSLDGSFNAPTLPAPLISSVPDDLAKLLALQPNGQILVAGKFTNSDGSARPLTRLNGDGSLDATFNPQLEHSNGVATVRQAQVLADGRILIGGRFNKINGISRSSLARLNADGSLDETFNAAVASSVFVVQSTGKIVVVSFGNQLVRLNSDGSVDPTFTSSSGSPNTSLRDLLLVQPDDKLILTRIHEGFIPEYQTTILRLNADGTNDPGFQPFTSLGGLPLLVQSDGKIVVTIVFTQGPSRLNADGSPDSSFAPQALGFFVAQQSDGKLITVGRFLDRPYGIRRLFLDGSRDDSFAPEIGLTRIAASSIDLARLLPNGKIVIAGKFNYVDRVARRGIAVLNNNGSVDPNFDAGDLLVISPYRDAILSVLFTQADGKILVGFEGHLVRLNPDGQRDDTFHYTPIPEGYIASIGLQPDGKIILQRSDGLLRLNRDGSRDSTFQPAQPRDLAVVQPDGKILIRVITRLERLNADGSLDLSFDASTSAGFLPPSVLALQADGKVLVNRFISGLQPFFFTRLNANGSIDPSFQPEVAASGAAAVDQSGIFVSTPVAFDDTTTAPAIAHLFSDGRRDPEFAATFGPGAMVNNILIQPDGQLIVIGNFSRVNGVERNAIARLNGSAPKKLANISTRARVGRAESVEIGGFIITGNAPKKVIVRALGPSLRSNGLIESNVLVNPSLELHHASGAVIAHNDDWREAQEEITASGIPPAENAEAAIVSTLAPGRYTAVVQGSDGGEGIALVEVYDLDVASDSKLANISTRGSVEVSDGVMIAGFILQGSESSTMALRALGPSLASSGVISPLSDPTLTLYDQSGSIVAANDDWRETQGAELAALGLGSTSDSDSGLIATLPPGAYTAVVGGANGGTGVGLVELYHVE